jgi:hypothetical protein
MNLNYIYVYASIGILIIAMVVTVILYRRKTRKNKKNNSNNGDDDTYYEIIDKIIHEALPSMKEEYTTKINELGNKISMIMEKMNEENTEKAEQEEQVKVNVVGVKNKKRKKLMYLNEDINVPKRHLVQNREDSDKTTTSNETIHTNENTKELKAQKKEIIMNKIIESIKNGGNTYKSIKTAVESVYSDVSNIELSNAIAKLIKENKIKRVENEIGKKTYTLV